MHNQRYSVTPRPIETLLTWVKSGEIAVPEIQRPFVWDATKVRNLLDSLYNGYPVGYLIVWQNPTVRLKDGTSSMGKRILIDGQQRITALMAALLGHEVLTRNYKKTRIRIAFHPQSEQFEVANPAIGRDPAWIEDISEVFAPGVSLYELTETYTSKNSTSSRHGVSLVLEKLKNVVNNQIGVIELASDLDIETVTEIFARVNSAGAELSQADFAMSKIAANESYGGNVLRKAIDYFCHLVVSPEFISRIEKSDKAFAASEFLHRIAWLKGYNDDIYVPTYTDMLRVAFTSEFRRGRLADLVALLSGRNFETRQYEDVIAEASFAKLKQGIVSYINKTHFECFTMIIRSAGFRTSGLIGGKNAVNFAYILYLRGKDESLLPADIERCVRRWYAMSVLRGRYTGSPETVFDYDIRQIEARGVVGYTDSVVETELPDSFWAGMLPQDMNTSSSRSPYFLAYQAAQVKQHDYAFLSRDIAIEDLLLNHGDVHHIYPKNYLRHKGFERGNYNQIANFAWMQTEINIAIGDKSPEAYFAEITDQINGGTRKYGNVTTEAELRENLRQNCIPGSFLDGHVCEYDEFLDKRRKLMALKIKTWFESL